MKTQTFIRTFVLTIFMSAAVSLQAAEVTVPQEEVYPIMSVDEQPTIEHDGKSLKFSDYLKYCGPMTVISTVVLLFVLPLLWSLV